MRSAVALPNLGTEIEDIQQEKHGKLYHVVLLDDDEHTYDYVIDMLQKLFFLSIETALQHAIEVDNTGRTVVITCERLEAEFARESIKLLRGSAHAVKVERLYVRRRRPRLKYQNQVNR